MIEAYEIPSQSALEVMGAQDVANLIDAIEKGTRIPNGRGGHVTTWLDDKALNSAYARVLVAYARKVRTCAPAPLHERGCFGRPCSCPAPKVTSPAVNAYVKRAHALGFEGMRAELDALLRGEAPTPARKARAAVTKRAAAPATYVPGDEPATAPAFTAAERTALVRAAESTIMRFESADHSALRSALAKIGIEV